MVNTLINGVLLGIFGFLWYYLGTAAPYVGSGGDISSGYMFFTVLAAAMFAGK